MSRPNTDRAEARVGIVIVDDHPMVRECLAEVINRETDLAVYGEAEDRGQALAVIREKQPQLVIVDLKLKQSNGLELIKDLHAVHPEIRILVVSMQEESLYAERVIRAGAHGYITKQEATRKILEAVRKVLAGGIYLSEGLAAQVAAKIFGRSRVATPTSIESLADRELQVFEFIGRGLSTRQIAAELHLDVKTIETYKARIKDKLGLKDARELLQVSIGWVHH